MRKQNQKQYSIYISPFPVQILKTPNKQTERKKNKKT